MRRGLATVALLGTVLALSAGPAGAGNRIRWEPGPPSVVFRHVTWPEALGRTGARTQLLADLDGRLLSMARADTALYAVFLNRTADVPHLTALLRDFGSPGHWVEEAYNPRLSAFLAGSVGYERIRLGVNGALTVHADEGRFPDKRVVAVVNGAGDILGVRPVWQSAVPAEEAASAQAMNPASPAPARRR